MAAPNALTFLHPQVEVRPQHSVEHGEALLVRGEACPALVFQRSPHLVYPRLKIETLEKNSGVTNRDVENSDDGEE